MQIHAVPACSCSDDVSLSFAVFKSIPPACRLSAGIRIEEVIVKAAL